MNTYKPVSTGITEDQLAQLLELGKSLTREQRPEVQMAMLQNRHLNLSFEHMLAQYPALAAMSDRIKSGAYFELIDGEFRTDYARPFPHLGELRPDTQRMTSEQRCEERGVIEGRYCICDEPFVNQPYLLIDLVQRFQETLADSPALSHSIICFTPVGDSTYWLLSPEDDVVGFSVLAGDGRTGKYGFLLVSEDGETEAFELESFAMLSLTGKDGEAEHGIFTMFNKALGLLYTEDIKGVPDLRSAKLTLFPVGDSGSETGEPQLTPASGQE